MIDYQLAKELKDAGFPQDVDGPFICECSYLRGHSNTQGEQISVKEVLGSDHERAYVPTLEELIEACGLQFTSLRLEQYDNDDGIAWRAYGFPGIDSIGSTPREAVARLYLALNKK